MPEGMPPELEEDLLDDLERDKPRPEPPSAGVGQRQGVDVVRVRWWRSGCGRGAARVRHWPSVADHYAEDPYDALDLYGLRLCQYAIAQAARFEDLSCV
ncbi:hypothetical protein ACFU7X_29555 [Streptomyces chartreusis]|uniref:hypothetical protein n=1 Tax=Streptomyces chartreusis TaxID=1969 RepID=UPI00367E1A2C